MPNGHSGGYKLSKSDFRALLDTFSTTTSSRGCCATTPDRPGNAQRSPGLNIPTREVGALLDRHESDHLYIEEQDGSWYIVHVDVPKREVYEDFRLHSSWVVVTEDSPLFTRLRALHNR